MTLTVTVLCSQQTHNHYPLEGKPQILSFGFLVSFELGPFLAYLLSQTVTALPLTFDSFFNILNFSELHFIRNCKIQKMQEPFDNEIKV